MPGKYMVAGGNEVMVLAISAPAVTFPTLAANASGTSTYTLPGVLPLDLVSWNLQAPPAHLVLDNVYVSAANTLTILWSSDATGISTGSVGVLFEVARVDGANLGLSVFPTSIL